MLMFSQNNEFPTDGYTDDHLNINLMNSTGSEMPVMHCGICQTAFTGGYAKYNLRRHIQTKHEHPEKIQCPLCHYKTVRKYDMKCHLLSIHSMDHSYIDKFLGSLSQQTYLGL